MSKKIRVIVKKPFKPFKVVHIPAHDYDHLRQIINCHFLDFISLGGDLVMAIDDEGKLVSKPANLKPRQPGYNDIIFGTVVIMRDGFKDLYDAEIEHLLAVLPIHFHAVTPEENDKIDPNDYCGVEMIFWD